MTPRQRNIGNRDLPANLYVVSGKWAKYFVYKHPQTGKRHGMGSDRKAAVDAAKQLNELFMQGRDLVAKVAGTASPFSDFLDVFVSAILPTHMVNGNPLAESTIAGYAQRVEVYRTRWGRADISSITLREIAAFLESYPPRMANIHRATLMMIWRYAKARGLVADNYPASTIKRPEKVARKPLSIEGFHAVREKAPDWFKAAMDLALESLQGRSEIAAAAFADVKNGVWRVIRKKTKSHGVSARLEIVLWPELAATIASCRNDIVSPFIVHKRPEKIKPRSQQAAERTHPTQILPAQLSREFAKARAKTEYFAGWALDEMPTFHEIRSLGADRKRKQGWPEDLIQKLMAHSDKEMTAHYLDKHDAPWTKIEID